MSRKILLSSMFASLLLLTACSLMPSDSPSQGATPNTAVPSGIPVTFGNVSLVIPASLASGASFSTSVSVEYPYINPSFGDMPEHTIITLTDYPLQERTARILVFPAEQYAQYTELTQKIITALHALPAQSSDQVPEDLSTTFFAQTKFLSNENGYGIRYLTEVLTGYAPINNQDIFTYYQGLSADGKGFIQAIIPIQAAFLVADSDPNSVVPADGIPFPFDTVNDVNAFQNYYDAVKVKLDAADLSAFTPSLGLLDELIQSIHISP